MKTISMAFASAAALLIGTAPASAALVESVSVENRFGYNFTTSGDPIVSEGGNKETVFVGQRAPTPTSDLGVDYVGTAGDGQFFFLHNNYCIGACSTVSSTTISFTVTNTGDADVDLRFDSLITPGHLARVDGPSVARGGFDFEVTQHPLDSDDITTLYSAFGNANDEELTVGGPGGSNEPFRGQVRYELAGGRVLDWDTTPLNLELGTLAAGATTVVEYTASYFVTSFDDQCTDITACGGLQVVFGDPRNNGSVTTFARGFGASAVGDPVTIINREYDAVSIPYAFNLSGSPLPGLPPLQGPVSYDGTYAPLAAGTVPEPATWLTLILGMALVSVALRRRATRQPAAQQV